MNLREINEFRIAHGLTPRVADPAKAAKAKQHERNKRERAAENRAARMAKGSKSKK